MSKTSARVSRSSSAVNELARALTPYTKISPRRFWADLLLCALLGWGALIWAAFAVDTGEKILGFILATVFLYRGSTFIHEVVHVENRLPGFRLAFNILFGFPNAYPCYIYDLHFLHHQTRSFGTEQDPEYAPRTHQSALNIIFGPLVAAFLLPVVQTLRFGLLPLLYPVLPRAVKAWLFQRFSTLIFNESFCRPAPTPKELRVMVWSDILCASYRWVAIALLVTGILPPSFLLLWYGAFVLGSAMNMYRALVNHDYSKPFGVHTREEQFLQSNTLVPRIWNELWAPLALSYHSLHHLSPAIPYHQLPKAHRHVMKDKHLRALYERTLKTGPVEIVSDLIRSGRMTTSVNGRV